MTLCDSQFQCRSLNLCPQAVFWGRKDMYPRRLITLTGMSISVAVSLSGCSDPVTQMRKEIKYPPCAVDEKFLRGQSC